jgi:hypothetical protein
MLLPLHGDVEAALAGCATVDRSRAGPGSGAGMQHVHAIARRDS